MSIFGHSSCVLRVLTPADYVSAHRLCLMLGWAEVAEETTAAVTTCVRELCLRADWSAAAARAGRGNLPQVCSSSAMRFRELTLLGSDVPRDERVPCRHGQRGERGRRARHPGSLAQWPPIPSAKVNSDDRLAHFCSQKSTKGWKVDLAQCTFEAVVLVEVSSHQ